MVTEKERDGPYTPKKAAPKDAGETPKKKKRKEIRPKTTGVN